MTWLYENPLLIIVIGGLTTAILGAGWLRTGRAAPLYLAIAALLLTVAALVVERLVVTDREQIDFTLHEIARLVERNDIDAALNFASASHPAVRAQAAAELPRYKIREIHIKSNLDIRVSPRLQPPQAIAEFNVSVVAGTADGFLNNFPVLRFVEVRLVKEEGQWKVASYAHYDPMKGARDEGRSAVPWPTER